MVFTITKWGGGGCPLIRVCLLIRSNTVYALLLGVSVVLSHVRSRLQELSVSTDNIDARQRYNLAVPFVWIVLLLSLEVNKLNNINGGILC